jgi:hypothetical protein
MRRFARWLRQEQLLRLLNQPKKLQSMPTVATAVSAAFYCARLDDAAVILLIHHYTALLCQLPGMNQQTGRYGKCSRISTNSVLICLG